MGVQVGSWLRNDNSHVQPDEAVARATRRAATVTSSGVAVSRSRHGAQGRPGLHLKLVAYFLAASLRCQASSVAGVTGKTPA